MLVIGLILSMFGIGLFCWLIFTLAVYVSLPRNISLWARMRRLGASYNGPARSRGYRTWAACTTHLFGSNKRKAQPILATCRPRSRLRGEHELRSCHCSRGSTQALRIRHPGKRQVLREGVELLQFAIQECQLLVQGGMAILGQGLEKVFAHRAQPPRDLHVFGAVVTYFPEDEVHEVFPIRRSQNCA
jgi:hypothetical protein